MAKFPFSRAHLSNSKTNAAGNRRLPIENPSKPRPRKQWFFEELESRLAPSTLTSDKAIYAPTEGAILQLSGFPTGETVALQVIRTEADTGIAHQGAKYVVSDGGPGDFDHNANGSITVYYTVPADSGDSYFQIKATGQASQATAQVSFTSDRSFLLMEDDDDSPPPATTTTISSSALPSAPGQSVTFTATVNAVGPVNTGTVQFLVDGFSLGQPVAVVNGVATSDAVDNLTPGNHTITASYHDASDSFESSGNSLIQVSTGSTPAADTTVAVSSEVEAGLDGQAATFTATISSTATVNSGLVQFLVDGQGFGDPVPVIGGIAISDEADMLSPGAHTITANYYDDSGAFASSGAIMVYTVAWVQVQPKDLAPGQFASIFAGGFDAGETITFQVKNLTNGIIYPAFTVVDGGVTDLDGVTDGSVQTTWQVPASALASKLEITAIGETSGLTAKDTFSDALNTTTTVTSNQNPSGQGQSVTFTANVSTPTTATLGANFLGVVFSNSNGGAGNSCNCHPPDTIVAAGPVNVIEAVNTAIRITDKTGTQLSFQSMASFFAGHGFTVNSLTDPFVLYDENISNGVGNPSGRFIVGMLDFTSGTVVDYLDLAVSNDWDATHGFTEVHQSLVGNDGAGNFFADYPRIGFNADALIVTFNMFSLTTGTFQHSQIWTADLNTLTDANNSTYTTYRSVAPTSPLYFSMDPAVMHNPPSGNPATDPAYLVVRGTTTPSTTVYVIKMTNVLSNTPTLTSTAVTVPSYSNAVGATQPGGTLFPAAGQIDFRMLNAAWRNNILVADQTIRLGTTGNTDQARWYQFSTSAATPTLTMSGNIAPGAGISTMYPSIDIDVNNNFGMTYMELSSTEYVSMYVTGRRPGDAAGTMGTGTLVAAGTSIYSSTTNRAGDFSGTSVDPATGTSFWSANEFVSSAVSSFWSTQVVNFSIGQAQTVNAGSVTFQDAGTTLATVSVSGGAASYSTSALSAGQHTITATYADNTNTFNSSFGTTLQSVNGANTTISSSVNPSTYGQSVNFTANVSTPTPTATALSGYNGLLSSDSNPTTINGTGSCNCQPPDTIVAAGPVNVVEMVNTAIEIRTKAGGLITRQKLGTSTGFFGSLSPAASVTDPFVIYDENISNGPGNPTGRFIVGMIDYSSQTATNFLDIAVSNDWDATHGFTEMHRTNVGAEGTSNGFADYPRVGYNADGFFVTFNMFALTSGQPFQHVQIFAITLASLIDANNLTYTTNHFDEPDSNLGTLAPAAMHSAPANGIMYFVTESDTLDYRMDVIKLTNYFTASPTFVDNNIPVASYTQPTAAPQSGGTYSPQIDSRTLNAAWRNNILVADHTVFDAGADHARWYQFDTSGASPTLTMEGDIAPGAGIYTMYPAIDIDVNNNLGFTYMQSSASQFVSMYVTGRTPNDPYGTMAPGVQVAAGATTTTNTRGGDYAGMSVDPATGTSFWGANEFFNNAVSSSWSTFVSNFSVASSNVARTTGAVQFKIDGVNFGSPVNVSAGSASSGFTTTIPAGSHTITADYSDTTYGNSSAALTQSVLAASTSTSVSSSSNPSVFGQSVSFTALVTNTSGTGAIPTGSVQFVVDGSNFGVAVALDGSGQAVSAATSALTPGNHTVTANYVNSDGNFSNSSGSLSGGQTVNAADTTTIIVSLTNPSIFGQAVTFTAFVTANSPSTATVNTGSVTFKDGATTLATVSVSGGLASFTTTATQLSAGSHTISANYSDGTSFNNSAGSVTQVVNAANTTTNLTVSSATTPNAAFTYGNVLTFTASVTANSPSSATVNTGTVTFLDGATTLATVSVNASGVATYATTIALPLSAGTHTITANYSDGTSFNSSTKSITVTVTKAPLWITANSMSKTEGNTLTLTGTQFTLAGPAGSRIVAGPTGPILFDSDSVTSVTLTTAGAAAGAEDGSYAIVPSSAVGSGLSNYNITYVPGTLTVLEPPINVSLTPVAAINEGDGAATVEVATFTHANGVEAPGHFVATVNWGVAGHTADAGTITQDGSGVYHVTALRPVFVEDGSYALSVNVSDADSGASIVQNFAGLSAHDDIAFFGSFFIPPDQGSAVGPNHYVEMDNLTYAIYNKDGTVAVPAGLLSTFYANAGITGFGTTGFSDPRIIYDKSSGRWFAVIITTTSNSNSIAIAVSQTSDPTGAWLGTTFIGNTTANNFADFPTIAIDSNALYIATNNFLNGTTFDGVSLTTIPKADLLNAGGPIVTNRSHFENIVGGGSPGTQPFTFAPVSDFGSRPYGVIIATDGFTPASVVHYYKVLNPGTASATLTADAPITVPNYWSSQNAHEPDGTRTLDSVGFRFGANNVYQVGNVIWAAQSILTSATTGNSVYDAIRWYEFDAGSGTLLQTGTISDPHHDFIFPAIAASADGNVVIGFDATGDSTTNDYPGIWYVAGTTTGGVTTFGTPTVLRNGSSNYNITANGRNRWGDFAAISVDPNDPNTFWFANEVVIPGNPAFTTRTQIWGTQVSAIRFGTKASSSGSLTVNEPAINGASATLASIVTGQASATVEVATFTHANGVEPTGDFTVFVNWGITGHTADVGTVTQDGGGTYHVSALRPVFNAGTYTVTVSISEDNASTTVNDTLQVNRASTSTAVTSSLNPSVYGNAVSFSATVSAVSPGAGTPTGTIQFVIDGVNFGSPVTLVGGSAISASINNLTAGTHTVTTVYGGDANFTGSNGTRAGGQVVNQKTLTITANNRSKSEGTAVTFAGTEFTTSGLIFSDSVTTVTLTSSGAPASAAVGTYSIVPSAAVGSGLSNYNIAYVNGTLTVTNVNPTVSITVPSLTGQAFAINTAVSFAGVFTDPGAGTGETYTATWTFDTTNTAGTVTPSGTGGSVTKSYTFTAAGVYDVKLTVTDSNGGSGTANTDTNGAIMRVVIYDPNLGFVTGGGTINVPAGSLGSGNTTTGQANFGFVSQYKKVSSTPSGETEFQFQPGNINFHASSYDWLTINAVVNDGWSQYQGTGTINNANPTTPGNVYKFYVASEDNQWNGGTGVDKFRMKIWEATSGGAVVRVIFDNQWGATDTAGQPGVTPDLNTPLTGGNIVLHKLNGAQVAGPIQIGNSTAPNLTQTQLAPIVQQAIDNWSAAGITPQQAEMLRHTPVYITDLPGAFIGMSSPDGIWLDRNAAGLGWFTAPSNASAFSVSPLSGPFAAAPGSPAFGKMDLLTVLEHEMGRPLGLQEYPNAPGIMAMSFRPGVRELPTAADLGIQAPPKVDASLVNALITSGRALGGAAAVDAALLDWARGNLFDTRQSLLVDRATLTSAKPSSNAIDGHTASAIDHVLLGWDGDAELFENLARSRGRA